MTPQLGSTVYEIATGDPWLVISTSRIIWLRSDDGCRLRQYSPRSFRRRRDPNEVSVEATDARRERERAAAVERYGAELVRLADANGLTYSQAHEAMR